MILLPRSFLLVFLFLFRVNGFVSKTSVTTTVISAKDHHASITTSSTRLYNGNNNNQEETQQEKLARLGYSNQELQERTTTDPEVNVNLIPNVDAASLTAVGFALIGFNFFVLANMGDGGIGGIVARIINTLNEM